MATQKETPAEKTPSPKESAGESGSPSPSASSRPPQASKDKPAPSKSSAFQDAEWGANHLAGISLFGTLSKEELKKLYARGTIRKVQAHAHVVIEGENSSGLFILLSGTVSVYKNDAVTGTMQRLTFLDTGANFGELSLIDRAPRSATVVAEKDCELFELPANAFDQFLKEAGDGTSSRFYRRCSEDLVVRLRQQNADYLISQQLLWRYALRKEDPRDLQNSPTVDGDQKFAANSK